MEELIKDILSKKELRNLTQTIVEKEINTFLDKNESIKKKLVLKEYNKRSKEYKEVLKEVRKILREIYGVFLDSKFDDKKELLDKLNTENQEKILREILTTHKSSKERLPYYKKAYQQIFSITGKGKIILDLACGLNPLSYFWLGYKPKYIASDISTKDMEFIQEFFNKNNIDGETKAIDLINEQDKIISIKADICFLFKTLDSLETRQRHISKKLINNINAKWIVISFSKQSLGGKKEISKKKRSWLIKFLEKNEFKFQETEIQNEFFIVVKK